MSSQTTLWFQKIFKNNALDRVVDRAVVFRRIGSSLKFRGVLDAYVGSLLLGLLAGVGGALAKSLKGWPNAAEAADWFFKNATELNIWFVFWTIGVACTLVATHDVPKKQGWFRRLLPLPFIRMTGDAFMLAFGAFLAASITTIGIRLFGDGPYASWSEMLEGMVLGSLMYLPLACFTTLCRLIVDGPLDQALFKDVNGHEPGLRRTLLLMGGGGLLTFLLVYWSILN